MGAGRHWAAVALVAVVLAVVPASASAADHAIAHVPDRGPYALLGDGQALGASLVGPASSYANYGGANNYVALYRAGYGTYFDLMVDWRGQPGRFLRLELRTPRSISYTCVTGPEDPANPSGPPLGAAIDATDPYGADSIQCYNATRDDGYYLYFSNDCFSILPAADPPAR